MYRNQPIQESNEIEAVTDEAVEGNRYVFVSPKRRRATRGTVDLVGGAPIQELDERPTTKMERLERPARLEIATVKMPQLVPHPDPQPCECHAMHDAMRQDVFAIAPYGPIFLVPIVANEAALLRGIVSSGSVEQALKHMIAVRHCPFNGTLMDADVAVRPHEPLDGELPACCGMMADLVRAGRIEIPDFRSGALAITKLLTADGSRLSILHCPFCGIETVDTALKRHKRQLGL